MGLRIIHSVVCSYYGLNKLDIFQRTRIKDVIPARQMFHYQARKHTKLSQDKIGRYYSERSGNTWDHASVRHSFNVIDGLNKVDKNVINDVNNIDLIIKGIDDGREKSLPVIKESLLKIIIRTNNLEDLLNKVRIYTDNILDKNNTLDI